jgi:hypothetical protein
MPALNVLQGKDDVKQNKQVMQLVYPKRKMCERRCYAEVMRKYDDRKSCIVQSARVDGKYVAWM